MAGSDAEKERRPPAGAPLFYASLLDDTSCSKKKLEASPKNAYYHLSYFHGMMVTESKEFQVL
jgi:hypothetical protein